MTAYVPVERAAELYQGMLQTKWESERNLLALFEKAPKDIFRLTMLVGTEDPLYCDAQVLDMRFELLFGFLEGTIAAKGKEISRQEFQINQK